MRNVAIDALILTTALLAGCGGEREVPTMTPVAEPGSVAFERAQSQAEGKARSDRAAEGRAWKRLLKQPSKKARAQLPNELDDHPR